MLASYLAGTCSEDERSRVLVWMQKFTAVAQLVQAVDPALVPGSVATTFTPAAQFASAAAAPSSLWIEARKGVSRLVACLVARVDDFQQAIAPKGSPIVGGVMDEDESSKLIAWTLPIPGGFGEILVRLRSRDKGGKWALELHGPTGLSSEAMLGVARAGEDADLTGRLADWLHKPIPLLSGEWEISLGDAGRSWIIPIRVDPDQLP